MIVLLSNRAVMFKICIEKLYKKKCLGAVLTGRPFGQTLDYLHPICGLQVNLEVVALSYGLRYHVSAGEDYFSATELEGDVTHHSSLSVAPFSPSFKFCMREE